MERFVLTLTAVLFMSGCAIYQGERYTQIRRQPVEIQAAQEETEEKPQMWYEALAEAVVGLVPSILREVRLTITDTTDTISSTVRDVKTRTTYEEVTYKRSAWFSTKPSRFQFLERPEKLESLKHDLMLEQHK